MPSFPLALDATSTTNTGAVQVSSILWMHTCSGVDRLLIVCLTVGVGATITSITYNGIAMTLAGSVTLTDAAGPFIKNHIYYLVAPSAGARPINVTFSQGTAVIAGATSWTGAHQTTPIGTVASAAAQNSSAPTVTVTGVNRGFVQDVIAMSKFGDPTAPGATVGSGQTQRWQATVGTTGQVGAAGSTEPGAASTTMSWTLGATADWAIIAVPINPVPVDILIPDGVTSAGDWVAHGAATLHECLDEFVDTADDDTTYIDCSAAGSGTCVLTFSNPTLPGPFNAILFRARTKMPSGGATIYRLYIAANLVLTYNASFDSSYLTEEATVSHTLPGEWTAADLSSVELSIEGNPTNIARITAIELVLGQGTDEVVTAVPHMIRRDDSAFLKRISGSVASTYSPIPPFIVVLAHPHMIARDDSAFLSRIAGVIATSYSPTDLVIQIGVPTSIIREHVIRRDDSFFLREM